MVIRDKQSLRRCVKQAVRRAGVTETMLRFDVAAGALGVEAAVAALPPHAGEGAPLSPDAAAVYAAIDALDLPVYDLTRAQEEAEGYEREAYLREVLDAMRARRVLVRVPVDRAGEAAFADDRLCPLLTVDGESAFAPGRFGVPYERAAQAIAASTPSGPAAGSKRSIVSTTIARRTACLTQRRSDCLSLMITKPHPSLRRAMCANASRLRATISSTRSMYCSMLAIFGARRIFSSLRRTTFEIPPAPSARTLVVSSMLSML